METQGYDCLVIPSVTGTKDGESMAARFSYSEFCGSGVTFKSFELDGDILARGTICCELS